MSFLWAYFNEFALMYIYSVFRLFDQQYVKKKNNKRIIKKNHDIRYK